MSRPRPRYSWPTGAKAHLRAARDHGAALTGPGAATAALPGAAGAVVLRRWLHGRGGARLTFINAVLRACALGLIGCLALAGQLGPAGYVALLGVSSLLSAWGVAGKYTLVADLLPPEQLGPGPGPARAARAALGGAGRVLRRRGHLGPVDVPVHGGVPGREPAGGAGPGHRGPRFAAHTVILAAPLGTALGGPLVAALGARGTLLASALGTIVLGLVTAAVLAAARRRAPAAGTAGPPQRRGRPRADAPPA